jgi:hypothetical protein
MLHYKDSIRCFTCSECNNNNKLHDRFSSHRSCGLMEIAERRGQAELGRLTSACIADLKLVLCCTAKGCQASLEMLGDVAVRTSSELDSPRILSGPTGRETRARGSGLNCMCVSGSWLANGEAAVQ